MWRNSTVGRVTLCDTVDLFSPPPSKLPSLPIPSLYLSKAAPSSAKMPGADLMHTHAIARVRCPFTQLPSQTVTTTNTRNEAPHARQEGKITQQHDMLLLGVGFGHWRHAPRPTEPRWGWWPRRYAFMLISSDAPQVCKQETEPAANSLSMTPFVNPLFPYNPLSSLFLPPSTNSAM